MIKRNIFNIFTLLVCSFSLFSCNSKDNFDNVSLDNYLIEKDSIDIDSKVCRISPAIDPKTCSGTAIEIDWTYESVTLFFKSDCTMTRNELGGFLKNVQQSNFNFESDKYQCTGTDFYTYSSKEKISPFKVSTEIKSVTDEKHYAFFYITDLQKYKVTTKDENKTFYLYISISSMLTYFGSI